MSKKERVVKLSKKEREYLQKLTQSGEAKVRKITRCRILLLSDRGQTDKKIAAALDVSLTTVYNIRRRYNEQGLDRALIEGERPGQPEKFIGKPMAKITAIACSTPPEGHARWSLRLLADHIIELGLVESISHQSVSNILKKTNLNRT